MGPSGVDAAGETTVSPAAGNTTGGGRYAVELVAAGEGPIAPEIRRPGTGVTVEVGVFGGVHTASVSGAGAALAGTDAS
jgi:hypothetical protein